MSENPPVKVKYKDYEIEVQGKLQADVNYAIIEAKKAWMFLKGLGSEE